MGLTYLRGGIPRHVNGTTANPTAVEEWTWEGGIANYLVFQNNGTGAIVLSFTLVDATAGIGVSVANGTTFEVPAEIGGFYTKSTAAQAFTAVVFLRRG